MQASEDEPPFHARQRNVLHLYELRGAPAVQCGAAKDDGVLLLHSSFRLIRDFAKTSFQRHKGRTDQRPKSETVAYFIPESDLEGLGTFARRQMRKSR
jgi:hypothetical protein